MTDDKHDVFRSQGSKQLPRHRQLLPEAELRRVFNHIVEQPIPKDLFELLEQIEATWPA